jgi:dimeric dUTPase (all-alpha-NTP-PPase superfamily)
MSDPLALKTRVMLQMQDDMNARVDPDWIARGRAWYRAVWIECAELMDHYGGWKWWKASACDREQSLLEIVDIWHFGLSMRITPARDFACAADAIAAEWASPWPAADFLEGVEALAHTALAERRFLVAAVPALLADLGKDFDDLYRSYVGKNVLNFFRQDHGYREGHYVKTWDGREDNAHLVELLAQLDSDAPDFRDAVYAALAARYPASDSR